MQIKWAEIDEVSDKPGVYAWYYTPKLSNKDINDSIRLIESAVLKNDLKEAKNAIVELLKDSIFSRFQETSYDCLLYTSPSPRD